MSTDLLVLLPLLLLIIIIKGDAILSFILTWGTETQSTNISKPYQSINKSSNVTGGRQRGRRGLPFPRDKRGVEPKCFLSLAHSLYLYDGVGRGVSSGYRPLTDLGTETRKVHLKAENNKCLIATENVYFNSSTKPS
jgi:hypothetical protein